MILVLDSNKDEFYEKIKNKNLSDLEIILPKNEKEILDNIKHVNIILANPGIVHSNPNHK